MAHRRLAAVVLPVGIGDEGDGGVEGELRRHRGHASRVEGQPVLESLERVEEEDTRKVEGEQRQRISEPALLLAGIDAGEAVERTLDRDDAREGAVQDAAQVGAERFYQRSDDGAVEQDLDPAVYGHGALSEPLGPDERPAEIDEKARADAGREDVVEGHGVLLHSRSQRAP